MIPTLKKAVSISLLLVLAAGAFIVARRFGLRPDPRMVRFLNAPSAVESFARRASAITDSGLNTGRGRFIFLLLTKAERATT
jgi:hypothetical protein